VDLSAQIICFCARLAVRLRGTFDRQLTVVPGPLEALVHEGISAVRCASSAGRPVRAGSAQTCRYGSRSSAASRRSGRGIPAERPTARLRVLGWRGRRAKGAKPFPAGYFWHMARIKRWLTARRKVVWSEPELPPYVKINPGAEPDPGTIQPGDISMGAIAREFLETPEEEPR